jgi:hypothetical protein
MDDKGRDVEFARRVKAAKISCRIPPDQAVGADDSIGADAMAVVEHEKVVATAIKMVGVTPLAGEFGKRVRPEPFIKDPITQRLGSIDVRVRLRQPHLKRARANIDDSARHTEGGDFNRRRYFD